jgi:DNA-binding NtrC family response regulator
MAEVLELAVLASRCDLPVLVLGPTGTGKNLVAEAIHAASARADQPLVKMHLTVPDALQEAHVFGARKGAYTGAVADTTGYVERAEGGTLFIDEIGNLGPGGQGMLLTLAQFGTWSKIGETAERRADVRLIAATSATDLRPDLLHRLAAVQIRMPSLAERVEDVPLLAADAVRRYARQRHLPRLPLSEDAVELLVARDWPGNVRELENTVKLALERAWCAGAPRLEARHVAREPLPIVRGDPGLWGRVDAYLSFLVDRELEVTAHDKRRAAANLAVSQSWLYKHLAERLRRRAR